VRGLGKDTESFEVANELARGQREQGQVRRDPIGIGQIGNLLGQSVLFPAVVLLEGGSRPSDEIGNRHGSHPVDGPSVIVCGEMCNQFGS